VRVKGFSGFARGVDWLNEQVGRLVAWLTVAMVFVCSAVVILRYVFSVGFIWMQELYVWTYAAVFLLAAGYTLRHRGHVRVDIFYANAGPRIRAWVDLLGTLVFLLPWLAVIAWTAWPYVRASWAIGEASSQTAGMPALYLLKSMLLVFCVLLGLQGLAMIARSVLVLAGGEGLDSAQGRRSDDQDRAG
jgi:TRAP-type mannitol/chloroaromatic compound transport system permease small subunit